MNQEEQRDLATTQAEIAFGMDVEAFMNTSFGRFLSAKANKDREEALEALAEVDPERPEAIRKLQNDIHAAERFLIWMEEAVVAGKNAEQALIASQD